MKTTENFASVKGQRPHQGTGVKSPKILQVSRAGHGVPDHKNVGNLFWKHPKCRNCFSPNKFTAKTRSLRCSQVILHAGCTNI